MQINQNLIDSFTIDFASSPNLPDIQDIGKLYAKIAWNLKSEKIENTIDKFGLKKV